MTSAQHHANHQLIKSPSAHCMEHNRAIHGELLARLLSAHQLNSWRAYGPILVVIPCSVLWHWQRLSVVFHPVALSPTTSPQLWMHICFSGGKYPLSLSVLLALLDMRELAQHPEGSEEGKGAVQCGSIKAAPQVAGQRWIHNSSSPSSPSLRWAPSPETAEPLREMGWMW